MIELRSKLSAVSCQPLARGTSAKRAFTLVEMLVAMAITLVMMAAVVTLFANVSNSVRNRRATIEMTGLLRHVRNTLQQDLQGATCPGVTWQRPDSNHGYIELIEGIQSDQNPTDLARDLNRDGIFTGPGERIVLDPSLSTIPRHNIGADVNGDGKITPQELELHYKDPKSLVLGGLGDHDDVLMLTVRNEHEPFVGRMPSGVREPNGDTNNFPAWGYDTIESPLAEVVWFCVENPSENQNIDKFYGEPGIRTIYRRTLLIAPWLNSYQFVDNGVEQPFDVDGAFKAEPGLVRLLRSSIARDDVADAIAAIIAFQDRYDLSVRLEWDHNIGRWKIMANTLADLTKRENRFGHYGFLPGSTQRNYPYAFMSTGRGYSGTTQDVSFLIDQEMAGNNGAKAVANVGDVVIDYSVTSPPATGYKVRPFAYIEDAPSGGMPATAQAMLAGDETTNEGGSVVRVTLGPAPLWGSRRGQDVMMTDVLGFDLRVYDPGAVIYGWIGNRLTAAGLQSVTVLQPSDPGWWDAYNANLGLASSSQYEFMGQGAYVDMGYTYRRPPVGSKPPAIVPPGKSWTLPWFAEPRGLSDVYGTLLAPGYSVYDTWSFHYENNGVNDDADELESGVWQRDDGDATGNPQIDEGTNGFDDQEMYRVPGTSAYVTEPRHGPDDVGEYETTPPYDKPLRGMQVLIRTYEPDSRAIRQVRVNQHFLPE